MLLVIYCISTKNKIEYTKIILHSKIQANKPSLGPYSIDHNRHNFWGNIQQRWKRNYILSELAVNNWSKPFWEEPMILQQNEVECRLYEADTRRDNVASDVRWKQTIGERHINLEFDSKSNWLKYIKDFRIELCT